MIEQGKKVLTDLNLWCFLIIVLGLFLIAWSIWGGTITCNNSINGFEAGLGLNPPKIKK